MLRGQGMVPYKCRIDIGTGLNGKSLAIRLLTNRPSRHVAPLIRQQNRQAKQLLTPRNTELIDPRRRRLLLQIGYVAKTGK